jgi:hypothetical protein
VTGQHLRPLTAFVVVAIVAGVVFSNGLRAQDVVDAIRGGASDVLAGTRLLHEPRYVVEKGEQIEAAPVPEPEVDSSEGTGAAPVGPVAGGTPSTTAPASVPTPAAGRDAAGSGPTGRAGQGAGTGNAGGQAGGQGGSKGNGVPVAPKAGNQGQGAPGGGGSTGGGAAVGQAAEGHGNGHADEDHGKGPEKNQAAEGHGNGHAAEGQGHGHGGAKGDDASSGHGPKGHDKSEHGKSDRGKSDHAKSDHAKNNPGQSQAKEHGHR